MAYLTSLGWMIALPIVLGVLAGWWLDRSLGSRPWGTLILLTLGITAAGVEVYLAMRTATRGRRD